MKLNCIKRVVNNSHMIIYWCLRSSEAITFRSTNRSQYQSHGNILALWLVKCRRMVVKSSRVITFWPLIGQIHWNGSQQQLHGNICPMIGRIKKPRLSKVVKGIMYWPLIGQIQRNGSQKQSRNNVLVSETVRSGHITIKDNHIIKIKKNGSHDQSYDNILASDWSDTLKWWSKSVTW